MNKTTASQQRDFVPPAQIAWDRIDDVLEPRVRELADKGEWEAPKRRAMARMFERWSRQLRITMHNYTLRLHTP